MDGKEDNRITDAFSLQNPVINGVIMSNYIVCTGGINCVAYSVKHIYKKSVNHTMIVMENI